MCVHVCVHGSEKMKLIKSTGLPRLEWSKILLKEFCSHPAVSSSLHVRVSRIPALVCCGFLAHISHILNFGALLLRTSEFFFRKGFEWLYGKFSGDGARIPGRCNAFPRSLIDVQQYIKIQYLRLFLFSVFSTLSPMKVANFIVAALFMNQLLNYLI